MSTLTSVQVLELLDRNVRTLDGMVDGVTPGRARLAAPDGGWSMVEVLAHLRCCADVWGLVIEAILTEPSPTIRAVNPRSWPRGPEYAMWQWDPSWHAFVAQRAGLLARLSSLDEAAWASSATVTGAGRPLTRTVLDYATRLATHERGHVRQLGGLAV